MSGKLGHALRNVAAEHKPVLGIRRRKRSTEETNALDQHSLREVVTLMNAHVKNTPYFELKQYNVLRLHVLVSQLLYDIFVFQ